MDSLPQAANLRRFALGISLALLAYSIFRETFESTIDLSVLGLSLPISRRFLDWVLPLVSIYAMARFTYYSLILSKPPFSIRRELKNQVIPIHFWDGRDNAPILDLVSKAQVYFPGVKCEDIKVFLDRTPTKINGMANPENADKLQLVLPSLSRTTKFLIGIGNLDYTVPIWMNGIALFTFFIL